MRSLAAILLLAAPALAIELPVECRIPNRGPMCCWSAIETLGKVHGVKELDGLRDYRYTKRGNEPAYDSVVKAELDRRGIEYRMTRANSFDTSLLDKYGTSHGAVVALKAGSGWSSVCHAVTICRFTDKEVEFYCSDKRLKNGVPGTWRASRAWFKQAWLGNSVVIFNRDALAPAETNDDSSVSAGASR